MQAAMGALCQCMFGTAPCTMIALPTGLVFTTTPAANIMTSVPLLNLPTFGTCSNPANPTVASATAAASGVLTPMPCIPATGTPWFPGCITVLEGGMPGLNDCSKCMCSYGGMVSISFAGQVLVNAT